MSYKMIFCDGQKRVASNFAGALSHASRFISNLPITWTEMIEIRRELTKSYEASYDANGEVIELGVDPFVKVTKI